MFTLKSMNNHQINRLGFGGWQLGNDDLSKEMTKQQGVELVKEAIKAGIVFFDTAPNYALGLSEEIIGLATVNQRSNVFINTKFGHHANDVIDFSPHLIEPSIKQSLTRIQTTYLDSVIIHNPNIEILKGNTEHFQILESLKQQGLIRYLGVSIDTKEEFKTVLENQKVDIIEIMFNIFFQDVSQYFELAKQKHIHLIAKIPLDSGWLTGKYNEHSTFSGIRSRWSKEDIERRAFLIRKLKDIVKEDSLIQIALAFVLSFDAISVVIPGIHSKEHLRSNLQALSYPLSTKMKEALQQFYVDHIKNKPLPW
jgi:aryl-alcohol dehydrogenase-like predicted oxidoreductase